MRIQIITTMNGTAKAWYDPSETIDEVEVSIPELKIQHIKVHYKPLKHIKKA